MTSRPPSLGPHGGDRRCRARGGGRGRRLAGLEERLRGERRREAGLKSQERALAEELALRSRTRRRARSRTRALTADHARLSSDVAASIAALATATDEREPLRMEAMGAEIAAGRLAEALTAARAALVERDRERDHAGFALERSKQELDILRDRIGDDLDLADPDEVLTWSLGAITTSPADREAEIARLRGAPPARRLRRRGCGCRLRTGERAAGLLARAACRRRGRRRGATQPPGRSTTHHAHPLRRDLRYGG